MLHLLAKKKFLTPLEQSLLIKLLAPESLQRINLWQIDYLRRSPLAVAVQSQNLDFIRLVAESDASLDRGWNEFFDMSSYDFNQILVDQFTPLKQTEYAKLRQ